MRYKIREEKDGAILFDREKGQITRIDEPCYQSILLNKNPQFDYLFDSSGNPDYLLYKSPVQREKLPKNCLCVPSKVYFELTRKCNLNCVYCYNSSSQGFHHELKTEKIFHLLSELSRLGTFEVRFTGGEPTLHSNFKEIVDYAVSLGLFISVSTSGVINSKAIEILQQDDIRIIVISLDGPKEYNDSKRGAGSFDKVMDTITNLKGKTIKLTCVICKENIRYLNSLIELADQLGIACVNITPLVSTGRSDEDKNLLEKEDMLIILKKISELRKLFKVKIQSYYDILDKQAEHFPGTLMNQKSCAAGIEVAVVSPFGEVYGCVVSPANSIMDSDDKKLFIAGNLDNEEFIDIWLKSSRWEAYRNYQNNRSDQCIGCRFYSNSCFGNCIVESYTRTKRLNSHDPYCFADLI